MPLLLTRPDEDLTEAFNTAEGLANKWMLDNGFPGGTLQLKRVFRVLVVGAVSSSTTHFLFELEAEKADKP